MVKYFPFQMAIQKFLNVYVVVSISNSVLSILTANFLVRIEKSKIVRFF